MTTTLTEHETGLLKLINLYGAPLDISGPRFSRIVRAAARELERKGLISGNPKYYSITEAGLGIMENAHDAR